MTGDPFQNARNEFMSRTLTEEDVRELNAESDAERAFMDSCDDDDLLKLFEETNNGAYLNELQARVHARAEAQQAEAGPQPLVDARGVDYVERIHALDREYGGANLRLRCLELAQRSPDGASPPPVEKVIERAVAYWRFLLKGEKLA